MEKQKKMKIKKKSFEFNRDGIVKFEEKVGVKLPKLKIANFEGTVLDWFWFWNQLETEINQIQISLMSMFSYLTEFLVSRVRLLIDALSFTIWALR